MARGSPLAGVDLRGVLCVLMLALCLVNNQAVAVGRLP